MNLRRLAVAALCAISAPALAVCEVKDYAQLKDELHSSTGRQIAAIAACSMSQMGDDDTVEARKLGANGSVHQYRRVQAEADRCNAEAAKIRTALLATNDKAAIDKSLRCEAVAPK